MESTSYPQDLCPASEVLVDFAQGGLKTVEFDSLHGHLDHCPTCRWAVAEAFRGLHARETPAHSEMVAPELRYSLLHPLGAGGMGVVYLAHDLQLDRKVALKVLNGCVASAEIRARLLNEAKAMARLTHPNVVTVFDAGIREGELFVAMELVEGRDVRQWLREQPRSTAEILDVFLQAAAGLAATHRAGMLHLDFKPDNVLVGWDGRVRVADFGMARAMSGEATVHGGTPAYMAPERSGDEVVDARADQYSFFSSLFEALTGERPDRQGEVDLRRLPAWLRAAFGRGLAPNPSGRHASMDEVTAVLSRVRRPHGRVAASLLAHRRGLLGTSLVLASLLCLYRVYKRPDILSYVQSPSGTWAALNHAALLADFYRWSYAVPAQRHPLWYANELPVSAEQEGSLWFLGGAYFEHDQQRQLRTVRRGRVPAQTTLFVLLSSSDCSPLYSHSPANAALSASEGEVLRRCASTSEDDNTHLSAEIDGKSIPRSRLEALKVTAPLFKVRLPADNLLTHDGWDVKAGTEGPMAAAGHVLVLDPLPAGHHTLHFHASILEKPMMVFDITYELDVDA